MQPPPPLTARQLTATGASYTINGTQVASAEDHAALMQDVRLVMNDVANIHATLTRLIDQLKG